MEEQKERSQKLKHTYSYVIIHSLGKTIIISFFHDTQNYFLQDENTEKLLFHQLPT